MRFVLLACRIALLVAIALAVLVLWMYGSAFLDAELQSFGFSPVIATMLAVPCTIILVGVAPALPVRTLFPSRAVAAAVAIGWLPLAASILLVVQLDGIITEPRAAKAVLEAAACWIAIVVCARLAVRLKT